MSNRLVLAGALVALSLTAPRSARAEYWAMTAGELLQSADEVLEVEVVNDTPGHVAGVVRRSLRGRAVGERLPLEMLFAAAPSRGTRLFVVCEGGVCPRAWSPDRGGFYVLDAQQPMDGASVLPGLVERRSVAALMAGRPAPALCVRARVRLLGEAQAMAIEARVAAEDGSGTARVGGDTVAARLLAPHGLGVDEDAALLRLGGPSPGGLVTLPGQISVVGGPLHRAPDGCYELDAMPAQPFVRTRRQLRDALARRRRDDVLARGRIHATGAGGLPRGAHPVELVATRDGQLELRTRLVADPRVGARSIEPGHRRIGFTLAARDRARLEIDLGSDVGPVPGLPALAAIASRARRDGRVSLPVSVTEGAGRTAAGRIELRYVDAP